MCRAVWQGHMVPTLPSVQSGLFCSRLRVEGKIPALMKAGRRQCASLPKFRLLPSKQAEPPEISEGVRGVKMYLRACSFMEFTPKRHLFLTPSIITVPRVFLVKL